MPDPLAALSSVEAIQPDHRCTNFDCGKPPLNEWLQLYALSSHRSDGPRTFVVHRDLEVKGYYSLATRQVLKSEGPERLGRGLGNYPIGVILLARLAVMCLSRGLVSVGRCLKTQCLELSAYLATLESEP